MYDGLTKSSPVLAEYCGVGVPNPVFSTGPNLMIAVNQMSNWAEEGFDATYTTSDKGSFNPYIFNILLISAVQKLILGVPKVDFKVDFSV